ncbi:MAG: TrmH family RNA methyltransferase [Bacteroidia bacterium]
MSKNHSNYKRERSPGRVNKVKSVLAHKQPGLTVVLENVHDPHNIMAVLRTCDAVGIYNVHIIESKKRTWDPKIGKNSSSGAKKWVFAQTYKNVDDCYAQLRSEDKNIYTTHMAKNSKSLYDLNLTQNVALVFGNEHDGVTAEAVEKADGNFLIPQFGMIQSLNISVACAVSLFEACRQRLASGMYNQASFNDEQYNHLVEEWLMK